VIVAVTLGVVASLIANEFCDVSPWLSEKIIRWSARLRYSRDPERAAVRSEELAALLEERPGNLFKVFTAVGFAAVALVQKAEQRVFHKTNQESRQLSLDLPGRVVREIIYFSTWFLEDVSYYLLSSAFIAVVYYPFIAVEIVRARFRRS
jgi:hypothetical protein